MILLKTTSRDHYSWTVVEDFERAATLLSRETISSSRHFWFWNACRRAGLLSNVATSVLRKPLSAAVVCMMGLDEAQVFPETFRRELIPFIFDCWPDTVEAWESFFIRHGTRTALVTSLDAVRYLKSKLPDLDCYWTPEAIDISAVVPGPALAERDTVLIEYGRSYLEAHAEAKKTLAFMRAKHVHPGLGAKLTGKAELFAALASSRASLCYPGSVSHPGGRTKNWEAMTQRYLEAVATKTLIVGKVPKDMIELFGFNPGVDSDISSLSSTLKKIHAEPEQFQSIVDESHARLLEIGTWDSRIRQVQHLLGQ